MLKTLSQVKKSKVLSMRPGHCTSPPKIGDKARAPNIKSYFIFYRSLKLFVNFIVH